MQVGRRPFVLGRAPACAAFGAGWAGFWQTWVYSGYMPPCNSMHSWLAPGWPDGPSLPHQTAPHPLLPLPPPTPPTPPSTPPPHTQSTHTQNSQPIPPPPLFCTGFARLVVSQRWDDKNGRAGDFLNFGLTLVGPLKLPVAGILAQSYTAALRPARSGAAVAAASARPLTAAGGN